MMIAAMDIAYANKTAGKSKNTIDIKHFEHAAACVNQTAGNIMDCFCYIDNLEDCINKDAYLLTKQKR